jgi:hypothetical protein
MQANTLINEVIEAMNKGLLGAKSDSQLMTMAAALNSWISSGTADMRFANAALGAIENVLAQRRAFKLSEQTASLTQEVVKLTAVAGDQRSFGEKLTIQTGELIEETVALKRIAEEQRHLAVKLESLTKWIVGLTVALLLLTIGVFVFTIYLYNDTHAELKRESATIPSKTEHP